MPTITVTVTKTAIQRGSRRNSSSCPVSLALRQAGFIRPGSADDGIWSDEYITRATIKPPRRVSRFIRDFDEGRKVKPFSFRLRVPARFLKKVAK